MVVVLKKRRKYTPVGTIHMCFTVKNIDKVYKKLKTNKKNRLYLFLGSTLGNFNDKVAINFLQNILQPLFYLGLVHMLFYLHSI